MVPRRAQTPISIRSDRAAARLALLTRDGRSQADVIEDALERLPAPADFDDYAAWRRQIEPILARLREADLPSMAEFDAREYDEHGNPR